MTSTLFNEIRRVYSLIANGIDSDRRAPYLMDWDSMFTPIERGTWADIRCEGLPFLPQFPIGRYFADFADPDEKVVIECDGRAFHQDKEKDYRRDQFMADHGWIVYRVTGSECYRVLEGPSSICNFDAGEYGVDWELTPIERNKIRAFYLTTVAGLISAIAIHHYGKKPWLPFDPYNPIRGFHSDDLIGEALSTRRAS